MGVFFVLGGFVFNSFFFVIRLSFFTLSFLPYFSL